MTKIYFYVCPVDGLVYESVIDQGEQPECPIHKDIKLKREGSVDESSTKQES